MRARRNPKTSSPSPSWTASHDPAAGGFVREGGVTRRARRRERGWDLFAPARRDAVAASIWIPQLPAALDSPAWLDPPACSCRAVKRVRERLTVPEGEWLRSMRRGACQYAVEME